MKTQTIRFYRAKPALRDTMIARGRRADWVAEQLGVSPSTLSKIFSGDRRVSRLEAQALASLLEEDIALLFELPNGCDIASDQRIELIEVPA